MSSLARSPYQSHVLIALLSFLLAFWLQPGRAGAYSYGNPNEEAIAEAYKDFAAALHQDPPDYPAAERALAGVREIEMDLHFGPEVAARIEGHLRERQPAQAIRAFEQALVLNIARRVRNAGEELDNYSQARLLLAKAFATYEALSPVVAAGDAGLDKELRADFDAALQALGNPGLFGVGERPTDPATFARTIDSIVKRLAAFFGMEEIEVGHFLGAGQPSAPAEEPPAGEPPAGAGEATGEGPTGPGAEAGGPGGGALPWVLAGVVVAAGLGAYLWRRRPRAGNR